MIRRRLHVIFSIIASGGTCLLIDSEWERLKEMWRR